MRLILHAGMPKAGSSALQVTLERARRSSAEEGRTVSADGTGKRRSVGAKS